MDSYKSQENLNVTIVSNTYWFDTILGNCCITTRIIMSNCSGVEDFDEKIFNCTKKDVFDENITNCSKTYSFEEKIDYHIHVYVIPIISIIGFFGVYHIDWIKWWWSKHNLV